MILFFILASLSIVTAIIYSHAGDHWDKADAFCAAIAVMFFVTGIPFLAVQAYTAAKAHKTEIVTYDVKLASLNDGSQVNGRIYGSLFMVRGYINEVEYFSYYRPNGDGSYSLNKKEADRSVVFPDTAAENAYVRITDEMTTCKQKSTWYYIFPCDSRSGIYIRGEFHVPEGSIANDFILDAQ